MIFLSIVCAVVVGNIVTLGFMWAFVEISVARGREKES